MTCGGQRHLLLRFDLSPIPPGETIHKAVLPRDVMVQRVLSQGSDLPIYAAGPGDSLYVVAARRTSRWTHPDARLAPIYYNRLDMPEDTMVVHADRGISVRLRPGMVRLFRVRR